MPFVPRLSVRARLTLTIIVVVVLTWVLGGVVVFQLFRLGMLRRGPPPGGGGGPRVGDRGPPPPPEPGRGERPGPEAFPPPPEGGEGAERAEPGAFPPPPPGEGGRGDRPPHRGPPPFWRDRRLLVHLGVGLILSVAAGVWLSRRFTRPMAMLAEGAGALRSGRFNHRVPLSGSDEFGRVATSMNEMAERIAEQIGELEEDSRRRQQLLADVAHELRSPVATLKTMAEALRDGIASGPQRTKRASQAIAESAARMERLVNDLLELARLDLHELPLHLQPVDVGAAVADCLRRHKQEAEETGIRIQTPKRSGRAMVSADPHRLAQILDNLLDNAISYAGEGADVSVTVAPGDPVTITVADSGRGIAAKDLLYVFDAFYRGDAARTPGEHHSGLGLRIARGLAEAHGGALRIESAEGEGTRAILTLPQASTDADPRQDD